MKNQALNKSDVVFNIFNYIVLLVLTLVTVYPFYYMFIYSISDPYLAHIGLVNVNMRLNLSFGESYGLVAEKSKSGGLKIKLKVPIT